MARPISRNWCSSTFLIQLSSCRNCAYIWVKVMLCSHNIGNSRLILKYNSFLARPFYLIFISANFFTLWAHISWLPWQRNTLANPWMSHTLLNLVCFELSKNIYLYGLSCDVWQWDFDLMLGKNTKNFIQCKLLQGGLIIWPIL